MGGGSTMKVHLAFVAFIMAKALLCSSMDASSSSSLRIMDTSRAVLIRVDQSGKGDYQKIQDAIDAVPSNNSQLAFIWVKPGTYTEQIVVPADKPFITVSGTDASNTIITWSEGGDIHDSSAFTVFASDFVGRYLTIQNTFGTSGIATALRVAGDRAAFYNCRILSFQDTLLDELGRHYFSNCYIEGGTDFICGDAASLYERCHLHSISPGDGAITAQHRESPLENTGFVFLGCKITGLATAYLGRPWGAYSRVVFAYSSLSSVILPEGWNDWNDPTTHSTVYYGEYKCYGPGAKRTGRVEWSKSLSSQEVSPFLSKAMIGGRGWLRSTPTHFIRPSNITLTTVKAEGNN
ncbi:Pectinesterase [Bertholletia excelsa]